MAENKSIPESGSRGLSKSPRQNAEKYLNNLLIFVVLMGIVFRQSAKSTIVIFSGAVLGAAINFIYTFLFSKTELGLVTNLTNQAAIMQVIVLMGAASLIVAYVARYPQDDPRRRVLITICFALPLIATLIFTLGYLIFKEEIVAIYQTADQPYIRQFYYWLPLIILGWSYTTLLDYYLISRMKTAIGTVMREIVLRLCTLTLIGLFFLKAIDFKLFIALLALSYLIPFLLSLYISIRSQELRLSFNLKAFSKKEYGQIFHFSWYHLLEGISVTMMGYIDSLMLAPLSDNGMASLSVYRNAIFIATIMIMPIRAISGAAYPVLNEAYIKQDFSRLKDLFRRTSLNTLTIGMAMLLVIACNLDNAVALFPEGYEQIKPVTLILLTGKLIQMSCGMNSEVIGFSKFYRFNFRVSILLLVLVIVLNRLLIPTYGIMGAAWGATLALLIFSVGKMFFLWKKMDLPPFSKGSFFVMLAGLITGVIGFCFPFMVHPVLDAGLRSCFVLVVYGALLLWLSPSSDFSQFAKTAIKKKRLF